jgi:hypothetical protein
MDSFGAVKDTRFSEINSWKVLFFNIIRSNYTKLKTAKIQIDDLVNEKVNFTSVNESLAEYNLFTVEEEML